MKTVMVYKAPDVLFYQKIRSTLLDRGIEVFGQDSSIVVIYPDAPNLYLGGISAAQNNYPIFVREELALEAITFIQEIEKEIVTPDNLNGESDEDVKNKIAKTYANRFYLWSLLSWFVPIIPLFLSLYYYRKSVHCGYRFSLFYLIGTILFFVINISVTIIMLT